MKTEHVLILLYILRTLLYFSFLNVPPVGFLELNTAFDTIQRR
jgi:hypothetical protein